MRLNAEYKIETNVVSDPQRVESCSICRGVYCDRVHTTRILASLLCRVIDKHIGQEPGSTSYPPLIWPGGTFREAENLCRRLLMIRHSLVVGMNGKMKSLTEAETEIERNP